METFKYPCTQIGNDRIRLVKVYNEWRDKNGEKDERAGSL